MTARARGGLGIVPARTQQHGYLWRRRDHARRSSTSGSTRRTAPIIDAIEDQLALLLDRFGCALLLDCHSMPPPPAGIAPIVFGDCRGRTADGWLSRRGDRRSRARCGFEAGLNDPFAGGHVIERHARPARGVHALQLEIDRRCYLDAALERAGRRASTASRRCIEALAVELGEALLGRQYATAAE